MGRTTVPGRSGSIPIHQDADVYVAKLQKGGAVEHQFAPKRYGWVQLIDGDLAVNGEPLRPGDGAAVSAVEQLRLAAARDSNFLFFDLN